MELFSKIIEWIWMPIVVMLAHLYQKVFALRHSLVECTASLDKSVAVLTRTVEHQQSERNEDVLRNQADHEEIKRRVDEANKALKEHNERVMAELGKLRDLIINQNK